MYLVVGSLRSVCVCVCVCVCVPPHVTSFCCSWEEAELPVLARLAADCSLIIKNTISVTYMHHWLCGHTHTTNSQRNTGDTVERGDPLPAPDTDTMVTLVGVSVPLTHPVQCRLRFYNLRTASVHNGYVHAQRINGLLNVKAKGYYSQRFSSCTCNSAQEDVTELKSAPYRST